MGEVVFRGPRALEALGKLFTNDLTKVADGQAQYGCLCREGGGIVDDVMVYRRAADDLLVCVNAGEPGEGLRVAGRPPRRRAEVANESDALAPARAAGAAARWGCSSGSRR